jgi:CHAT domain-containing protein/Tfp pilus assembly protein PilF
MLLLVIIFFLIQVSFVLASDDNIDELFLELESLCLNEHYSNATSVAQKIVELTKYKYGQDHIDYASTLTILAELHTKIGNYEVSRSLHEQALAVREKIHGPGNPDVATSLNSLARIQYYLKDYSAAQALAKRALLILETIYGAENADVDITLNFLARVHCDQNDYSTAQALYERSLSIREKAYGAEHPDVASTLGNLAAIHVVLGNYAKAKILFERIIAILEKKYGPEHPEVASYLTNLGGAHRAFGDYAIAKILYERALTIFEKNFGTEHPEVAICLIGLGETHYALGDYALAIKLNQRALSILKINYSSEHPAVLASLNNIAAIYFDLGDYYLSKEMFEKILKIQENNSPNDPSLAISINNIARVCKALGEYEKSIYLYNKAMSIFEKNYGSIHPDVANCLQNLGGLYYALKNYSMAKLLNKKSLYIRQKLYGINHPIVAKNLSTLAVVEYSLDDFPAAMVLLEQALHIAELSNEPLLIRYVYANMRRTFSAQKLPGPAIFFGKRAVNILQSLRSGLITLDKELQKSFLETYTETYKALADLLMSEGRLAEAQAVLAMLKEEEFFSFIRRDAKNDNRTTTVPFSKGEEPWEVRYQEISGHLAAMGTEMAALKEKAKLGLTDADKDRLKDLDKDLRVAQKAFQHFLTELQDGLASAARAEEIGEKNLKDLRAFQGTLRNLGSGTVLLHYLVSDEKLWILLTTTEVQIVRHVAINASDLNLKIGAWRQSLTNPQGDPLPLAREMYELLVAPVAGDLEAAKTTTLMLSLDGMLRYVPFAALHDGQQWLAEQYNLALFTEAAKTKLTDRRSDDLRLSGLGVTKAHGEFAPLPAVKGELYAIQSAIPGETLLDEEFTSDALRMALLLQYPVLHIASHFHFNPGTEERSFLLLGDGTTLSLADIRDQTFDFNGVEILTLSACETAMGGGADGREIEGLGALAQRQGAKGVLATLWPVADESTGQFMGKMYGRLSQGDTTKAEALRSTQLDFIFGRSGLDSDTPVTVERGRPMVLKQEVSEAQNKGSKFAGYSHPYYWAPFILMGNWL